MKKLSLFAMLTLLIGSALFVTSCGGKVQADSVWQMTKGTGGMSIEAQKQYVCFCADGKMIAASNFTGTLRKFPAFSGSYTAKNGKMKAPITGNVEADYKIKGETMTISRAGVTLYELKKVSNPTAKEMKAL